jgi:hypothetical protein
MTTLHCAAPVDFLRALLRLANTHLTM